MPAEAIHRFEQGGKRFAMDPETCFCFECDAISWDVLGYYPHTPVNRILHELGDRYDVKELNEVIGELEWLRATRSILAHIPPDKFIKQFETERGLKRLVVCLPSAETQNVARKRGWFGQGAAVISQTAREIGRDAVALLLSRSGEQKELTLEFLERGYVRNPDHIADLCAHATKLATLAGKRLSAGVHITDIQLSDLPESLRGHDFGVRIEFRDASIMVAHVRGFAKSGAESLARLVKQLQPAVEGVSGRIVVRPRHPRYGEVVMELDKAGFKTIEIDLDGAYVAHPELQPAEMLDGIGQSAVYYAKSLLEGRYFRLDPIAGLFYRIHEGIPLRRFDPAGAYELAVDRDGGVYPSWRMLGKEAFRLGSLADGVLREELLAPFDDVGALTTNACRRCWARNLCGGGTAAVHDALTGSIRTPHDPWCDTQRAWMASAVSAFNILSAQGVNFSRLYRNLGDSAKPSLWTMARAALQMSQMTVAMRPIEETDASMLVKWENWCEATYFLGHPRGLLLATAYDREMDALHPQSIEQEMVLTRRDGSPFGLLRLSPDLVPGVALAWIYMHDPRDYTSEEIRKGFRLLLKEAGKQQGLRRVIVPAADREPSLQEFLHALGFSKAGALREALFLHAHYHDMGLFVLSTE